MNRCENIGEKFYHNDQAEEYVYYNKTEERVALRKQCLNEKTAASVLLKLFISGNERCHTTDAP